MEGRARQRIGGGSAGRLPEEQSSARAKLAVAENRRRRPARGYFRVRGFQGRGIFRRRNIRRRRNAPRRGQRPHMCGGRGARSQMAARHGRALRLLVGRAAGALGPSAFRTPLQDDRPLIGAREERQSGAAPRPRSIGGVHKIRERALRRREFVAHSRRGQLPARRRARRQKRRRP